MKEMNEQITIVSSLLPAAAILVPLCGGVLVLLGRKLPPRFWQGTALVTTAASAVMGFLMAARVLRGEVLVGWGEELRVDALSALMVVLIAGVCLLAIVYSVRYFTSDPPSIPPYDKGGRPRPSPGTLSRLAARHGPERALLRLPVFYCLVLWFLATMLWGCVTNNIVMLYVAVEATTLTSGLLVAFFWDRRALEAGYKYLMLLTIGITFAFVGCVLIYASAASTGALASGQALLISEVRRVLPLVPAGTALITVGFLVVGFGTKAGLAPFHPWLPDAHAEAPTPISVLLSGVMIKMAAYALARTASGFFPAWPQLTIFLVALGAFSVILGMVMALAQDDLKRLLAYSSVSQIGYVVVGIGLGTWLGCFGGLYHLVNHAVTKGLLFMCAGAVIASTGARRISELRGIARRMPITGVCFVAGALAISGFPPFGAFFSKLAIFLALARAGLWWACVAVVVGSVLTTVVLVRAAYAVFWSLPAGNPTAGPGPTEVKAAMWLPMVVLAVVSLALGVLPEWPFPLLDRAAEALATLGR